MARIYISSTYQDLRSERMAVRDAILHLGHMPAGMEGYNASETPPLELCLADVATCDVYVGICAWRYGFIPPGEVRSITECEYDRAGGKPIPRLIFLLAVDAPWPMSRADVDRARVTSWRARLEQRHVVAYFTTAEDLAGKVIAALVKTLRPAPPPPSLQRSQIPKLLPYLSDRGPQEAAIRKALSAAAPHPVVCIVHGDELQCHGELLLRLKQEMLPRLLGLEVAVTARGMGWPPDFTDRDELHELLMLGLARELSLGDLAVEKIDAALEALPGPALVYTEVLSRDLERRLTRPIEDYLDLWQRWPELRPGRRLLVILFVKYQLGEGRSAFKRWRLSQFNQRLADAIEPPPERAAEIRLRLDTSSFDRLTVKVVPLLRGVTETEARTWAQSETVARVCSSIGLLADISKLYREWEARTEKDRIPMDTLADKLKEFLEQHCRQEILA